MKIILASDDGEVLDSEHITREEFLNLNALGAQHLLANMSIGDAK